MSGVQHWLRSAEVTSGLKLVYKNFSVQIVVKCMSSMALTIRRHYQERWISIYTSGALRRDRGPNTNDDYSPDENLEYPSPSRSLDSTKYMSLSQTMKMLGHTDRVLDILKIDCEGCEWNTFTDWIGERSVPSPRQVLIEVHRSPAPFARNFFDEMKKHGYIIFHKEPNLPGCPRGDCIEYGFLKLHLDFYSD